MNSKQLMIVVSLLMVGVITIPALCEDDEKVLGFNPFKKGEKTTAVKQRVTDQPESTFSWPKLSMPKLQLPKWDLMPKSSPQPKRAPTAPSTWNKFTTGTKTFFTKTKNTLLPWTTPSTTQPTKKVTGSQRIVRRKQNESPEKFSLLPSFFSSDDGGKDPEELQSVNDFLKLQKPRP